MKTLKLFSVILFLFVLSGLFLVKNVYADVSNKDIGLNSEERTSIRNFEKQTKKSIEDVNSLIRKKELEKAKKELEDTLVSIKGKISLYENNAQILVSKGKENSAKIYYREASSIEKLAVQISKSLQKLETLQKEAEAKKLQEQSTDYTTKGFEYLKADNLDKAEENFKKAINIRPDNREAKDGLMRVERARVRLTAQRVTELLKQARSNISTGNLDEAEIELQEVLKLESDNRQALNYLQQTKQAKKEHDSKQTITRLINEGKKYISSEQFDKAEAVFQKALKMSPSRNEQVEIRSLLTDVDNKKQTLYNKKLQKQADDFITEGIKYLKTNEFEKAEELFNAALNIIPEHEKAKEYLQMVKIAKLEGQNIRLLGKIESDLEQRERLKQNELEISINQLINQITNRLQVE